MSWSIILFLALIIMAFVMILYFSLPSDSKKKNVSYEAIVKLVHNHNNGAEINYYIGILSEPKDDYPKVSYLGWKNTFGVVEEEK